MALPYIPKQGEVLICDFDDIALGGEMIKRRPVVVLTKHERNKHGLCTIVPFSTTPPDPPRAWHHEMPHLRIKGWKYNGTIWAKCDMLSTVSLLRLNKPYTMTRHGRNHVAIQLDHRDMTAITAGVLAYLS